MERENGKKKKVVILLAVLLMLVVAGGAAAFFLFGTSKAENLAATYNAKSVSAVVEATYQLYGQNSATNLTTSDGKTQITFDSSSSSAVGSFVFPNDIVLNESTQYVLFTYTFTNTIEYASSEDNYIKISFQDNSTKQNVSVKYLITSNELVGDLDTKYQTMSAASTSALTNATYLAPTGKVVFQILVERTGENANYVSNIKWSLEATSHHQDEEENPDWNIDENNVAISYNGSSANLIVPENVLALNDGIFANNEEIVSITIPSNVRVVGAGAFENCTHLQEVNFQSDNQAVSYSGAIVSNHSNTLGNGEESGVVIRARAFKGCINLRSVVLPDDIETLEEGLFNGCTELTSFDMPNSIKNISNNVFNNCTKLRTVTFSNNLETIGIASFNNSL